MTERNEIEHKDLIKTANAGVGAMKTLKEKYSDVTVIKNGDKETPFEEGFSAPENTPWPEFKEKE